jgi:hypothetical protein
MRNFFSLLPILLALLLLSVILGACGGSSTSSPQSSGQQQAQATSGPISTADMQSYQDTFYSISYPKSWVKTTVGDNAVFTGSKQGSLTIEAIANPNAITPATAGSTIGINGLKAAFPDNFQQEQISATTTINGITWNQGEISGSSTKQGQTRSVKSVVLSTNHPDTSATTKLFLVIYTADTSEFDQLATSTFEPMLNTLKLTS